MFLLVGRPHTTCLIEQSTCVQQSAHISTKVRMETDTSSQTPNGSKLSFFTTFSSLSKPAMIELKHGLVLALTRCFPHMKSCSTNSTDSQTFYEIIHIGITSG